MVGSVSESSCDKPLSGSILDKVIGTCPESFIKLNNVNIRCLLDTGAQVSTLTESCFKKYFAHGVDLVDVSNILSVSGTQGLSVPLVGYAELDVQVFDQNFSKLGFLVVKDPQDTPMADRKKAVPGVVGSNDSATSTTG